MATGQMVPAKERVNTVRALLEKSKAQIAMALPRHMTSDRMLRVAMTEIQKNPVLLECAPMSLVACVVQAAQLGLEIGVLGHAYLVPFNNRQKGRKEVQLIPGYRGLVQLARRSGEIVTFEARVVHAKDVFEATYGLEGTLKHKPSMDEDSGPVVAAYAFAKFKDGGYQYEVMSVRELDAIRKRSKAADSGPWVTDTEEMYRKTVARRLCKWLPASIELATAIDLDNKVESGLPQDLEVITVEGQDVTDSDVEGGNGAAPEVAGTDKSKLDAAAEELKQKQADAPLVTPAATSAPVVDCTHPAIQKRAGESKDRGKTIVCPDCTLNVRIEKNGLITVLG